MKKSIAKLVALLGVAFVIVIILNNVNHLPTKGHNKFIHTIPAEYLDLFSPGAKKQFDNIGTIEMSSGLPVSSLIYTYINSSGRAYGHIIELFKDSLKENILLDEVIQINKNNRVQDSDNGFIELRDGGFNLRYKAGKDISVFKVTFNFNGDILKLIRKTDNMLYFNIQFDDFNIKYNNGNEIWAKKTSLFFLHETGKFIFLKKNRILYTIFISDADISSKPDTALNLLNPILLKN